MSKNHSFFVVGLEFVNVKMVDYFVRILEKVRILIDILDDLS